jgi:Mce-associated membrane protein
VEVVAAPDGNADDAAVATTKPSGRPPTAVLLVAGLLVVVLIVAVVIAVQRYGQIRDQHRLDDDRRDALTAAEQFALRMDALDASNLDAYQKSIEPLLTTKEKTEFSQQFDQFRQLLSQAQKTTGGTTPKGKIQLAGVADADSDSANVLVAHDSTGGSSQETLHSRWTLGMRKIGGKWLVDSFVPVS